MGSSAAHLNSALSRPTLDIGAILRSWNPISAVLSTPSDWSSFTRYIYSAGQDGTVNWSKLVFLTTFFFAMAGCGLFSSLTWRRLGRPSHERTRLRRGLRRNHTKVSAEETITSSDEEEFDSKSSLRPGTDSTALEKDASSHHQEKSEEAHDTDPGLLKKHSSYLSYSTSIATYPSVRTFYRPHPQMDKLPTKPSPIPLLVFVHGLGGSLAQFNHLLTTLSNVGPCFGIDLPGCGLSDFAPTTWDAYTVNAMAELLATSIDQHRDKEAGQGVILIAHSLGCSLSALLASSASSLGGDLKQHILGLIAVCPRASPPSPKEVTSFRRLLQIPGPIFDIWRSWDRRGGLYSASVNRLVGAAADPDTRHLQVRYNKQSKTAVWRRMAWGTLPEYDSSGKPTGGIPGRDIWAGVTLPVLLVAGESDAVTKPGELRKILNFFGDTKSHDQDITHRAPEASQVHDQKLDSGGGSASCVGKDAADQVETKPTRSKRCVKTVVLPAPASHALIYDRATYRTLSGIIQDFLRKHVDHRLSLGWQLQHLNTSGKWDVKNLVKWQKVPPVSERIADTFVALKMLREVDEEHNPQLFAQKYHDKIYAVIDISYENPVYNPASLERGGIHYHKHPTVSKIPPTPDETRDFIALVDRLQGEITEQMEKSGDRERPVVGVHCHYGFNRTGFLLVSYLIERCGYSVQEAIDEFERQRPPGIRHGHFMDTLFVRYCVGLQRAPTL